jgi:hypothetical protein
MRDVEKELQVGRPQIGGHEAAERFAGEPQALQFADPTLGERQDPGSPRVVHHRLHDEERQEQRQPDQHHVGRRTLRGQGGAQQRQHDHDAREGGDHHQQARRQRQHGDQRRDLHQSTGGTRPARAAEIDVERLRVRHCR